MSASPQETVPAHLWVGPYNATYRAIIALLKQKLCKQNGCSECTSCRMIDQQQHHAILWLTPEGSYTRETLAPLFQQLSFKLDDNESFFCVIEKADFLTTSCSNSLLKSLEEPPEGYHFMLLAERLNLVLPTIQSRCIIHQIRSAAMQSNHPLFDFFTSRQFHDPLAFAKSLDQSGINERESIELLDQLLTFWIERYLNKPDRDNENMVRLFSTTYKKSPMPGSSKLFWRNLFMHLKSSF